jgi:hypothetical protein
MIKTLPLNNTIKYILFDILALTFIYFMPALSHLTAFPLYLLEPMRIAIVMSMLFTSRKNTYLIALTIPLFSFLLSSHPHLIKSLLITSELLVNVFLFYVLFEKLRISLAAMFISIIAAKLFYYLGKYILLSAGFIEGSLVSTPLLLQLAVALTLSIITAFVFKERK